ncbi:lipocalin family protein [Terriglobus tenax]|uniref:lipocalin family protein n=1 Tax=Terriglobus tenax TaxID=1111115 RepID=UPI0021DFD85E|nr:lipocalin family protein [Terriglobus tenax]
MIRTVAALLLGTSFAMSQTTLKTVEKVDLQRYAGKWYELARLPNRFEKKCDRDVTAEYALDGSTVSVTNTCVRKDGSPTTSRGKAKVVDAATNAKLKVTFFWPFYGNYWVIGLDPEYRWAIVGEPSRKYLWILSRTPSLPRETMDGILQRIKGSGYRPEDLLITQQTLVAR